MKARRSKIFSEVALGMYYHLNPCGQLSRLLLLARNQHRKSIFHIYLPRWQAGGLGGLIRTACRLQQNFYELFFVVVLPIGKNCCLRSDFLHYSKNEEQQHFFPTWSYIFSRRGSRKKKKRETESVEINMLEYLSIHSTKYCNLFNYNIYSV